MIGRDIDLTEGLDFGKDPKSNPIMRSNNKILKDKEERKAEERKLSLSYSLDNNSIITANYYYENIDPNNTYIEVEDIAAINHYQPYSFTSNSSNNITSTTSSTNYPSRFISFDASPYYYSEWTTSVCNLLSISSYDHNINNDAEYMLGKNDRYEKYKPDTPEAELGDRSRKVLEEIMNHKAVLAADLLSKINEEYEDIDSYLYEVSLKGNPERHKDLDNDIICPWLRKMKSWNYDDYIKELTGEEVNYMEYLTNNWYHPH